MKHPSDRLLFGGLALTVVAVIAVTLMQCSKAPTTFAGGASSTEVSTCIITGTMVDSLDNPIPGGTVKLRSFDYTPLADTAGLGWTIRDTVTDGAGRYHFERIAKGRYCIELVAVDSLGSAFECSVDSGEAIKVLQPAPVRQMAVIRGSNMPSGHDEHDRAAVQTRGLEHSASVDSMGNFTLKVPAGWTRLNLMGVDSLIIARDTLVYLIPGEHVELRPESVQQKSPKPCDSLGCDMAIVRQILDESGLPSLAAESVAVVSLDHVSELHLRGRGISVLSRAVGKLLKLRVLDIGNNLLDTLPSTLDDHMKELQVIIVDSNHLWKISASIGMMQSLQKLDLSSNLLQSLPEPITYLRTPVDLDVGYNLLCNIGEQTKRWLDEHDRDWKETQECR
jgi:hypothetical protein